MSNLTDSLVLNDVTFWQCDNSCWLWIVTLDWDSPCFGAGTGSESCSSKDDGVQCSGELSRTSSFIKHNTTGSKISAVIWILSLKVLCLALCWTVSCRVHCWSNYHKSQFPLAVIWLFFVAVKRFLGIGNPQFSHFPTPNQLQVLTLKEN